MSYRFVDWPQLGLCGEKWQYPDHSAKEEHICKARPCGCPTITRSLRYHGKKRRAAKSDNNVLRSAVKMSIPSERRTKDHDVNQHEPTKVKKHPLQPVKLFSYGAIHGRGD